MRFLYLSDTHVGADPMGYYQQPPYVEKLPELLHHLDAWMQEQGNIDFILHGGDMTDMCSPQSIAAAAELFSLSVPVYLCLGNHDMQGNDILSCWKREAPSFFPESQSCFSIIQHDAVVHALPTHWDETPYLWESKQDPHFLGEELVRITSTLRDYPDRPHILCTHAPVYGLPPAQSGYTEPIHGSTDAFQKEITDLCKRFPQLVCVLGAHTHMNMLLQENDTHFATVSAFVESPFEFKLLEVNRETLRLRTHSLYERLSWKPDYNFDKTYVQGRPIDRMIELQYPPAG